MLVIHFYSVLNLLYNVTYKINNDQCKIMIIYSYKLFLEKLLRYSLL